MTIDTENSNVETVTLQTPVVEPPAVEEKWDRARVAQSLVNRHTAVAAAAGLIPVPFVDLVALTGVQLNLISRLADLYDVEFTKQAGMHIVTSLLAGSLPVVFASTASSVLKSIPFVGTIGGAVAMPATASAVIYGLGQVMIRHFESGGTLLNFDAQKARKYFQEKVNEAPTVR